MITREAWIFLALMGLSWLGVFPFALWRMSKSRGDIVLMWLIVAVLSLMAGVIFLTLAGNSHES